MYTYDPITNGAIQMVPIWDCKQSSNAVKCMPSLPAAFTSLFLFLYQTLTIQLAGQHKNTCFYITMENTVQNMSQDTLLPEKSWISLYRFFFLLLSPSTLFIINLGAVAVMNTVVVNTQKCCDAQRPNSSRAWNLC